MPLSDSGYCSGVVCAFSINTPSTRASSAVSSIMRKSVPDLLWLASRGEVADHFRCHTSAYSQTCARLKYLHQLSRSGSSSFTAAGGSQRWRPPLAPARAIKETSKRNELLGSLSSRARSREIVPIAYFDQPHPHRHRKAKRLLARHWGGRTLDIFILTKELHSAPA